MAGADDEVRWDLDDDIEDVMNGWDVSTVADEASWMRLKMVRMKSH